MSSRTLSACLTLLFLSFAGCSEPRSPAVGEPGEGSSSDPGGGGLPGEGSREDSWFEPGGEVSPDGWRLDCGLPAASGWPQECVSRISQSPRTKAEMWVGVNPTDPDNVVVAAKDMDPELSNECVWSGLFVTHDGGQTWVEVALGGRAADRQPTSPFYGYDCNSDPMFRFAKDGTLHFGVELVSVAGVGKELYDLQGDIAMLNWKILLATSHDGGLTWPDVITWQPDLLTITDYSRMAISPATGTIFEAINHLDAGLRCQLLSSRDGGRTPGVPVPVFPSDGAGLSLCRGIAVSEQGTVLIAFKASGLAATSGISSVRFMRSTDDGLTFGSEATLGWTYTPIPDQMEGTQAPGRSGQQLELVYDFSDGPGRGTLWAITAEAPGGDADVYVRSSKDDALTWSEPIRVNGQTRGHQYMANMAVAGDGSLHAVYYDKGYDPEGRLIDITHSWSQDQGATWSHERVTTVSWDGDLGRHQAGYPWIGDYTGIDAVGDDVWAAFPDTSLGDEPVAAASHFLRSPSSGMSAPRP